MNRQILTIGLTDNINDAFKKYLALDQVPLVSSDDTEEAIKQMGKEAFRLIICDASPLSADKAQETVDRMRRITYAPILMLTQDDAAAVTLEAGADMCIPPNVNAHMLFAVAMALARRNESYSQFCDIKPTDAALRRGDLMIDSPRHTVLQSGKEIRLLPMEFRLLAFLARNPGIALTPEQISPAIWLDDNHTAKDVARVIAKLRSRLGDHAEHPSYIQTVHGVGYRFLPSE